MRETEYEGIGGGTKPREGQAGAGRAEQEGKTAPGLASRDDRAGIRRESDKVGETEGGPWGPETGRLEGWLEQHMRTCHAILHRP